MKSIITVLYFKYLTYKSFHKTLLGQDEDTETVRRILGKNVQDVMTRKPVTVTTNDLMKSAAETMAKHR